MKTVLAVILFALFAGAANTATLNPTVSSSTNYEIESTPQPIGSLFLSVVVTDKTGNSMSIMQSKNGLCLVDKGNVKPIAKVTVTFEDGTKFDGKLVASPDQEMKTVSYISYMPYISVGAMIAGHANGDQSSASSCSVQNCPPACEAGSPCNYIDLPKHDINNNVTITNNANR